MWNHGSPESYDGVSDPITIFNPEPYIDRSLAINLDEVDNPKVLDSDFQGIPGYEVDMGNLNKNTRVLKPYTEKELIDEDLYQPDSP